LRNINKTFLKNSKEKLSKNTENPHDLLVKQGGNFKLAIRYAKKKDNPKNLIKPNPSTGVYRFLEVMSPYFDKQ
jgi:hypothetical protein